MPRPKATTKRQPLPPLNIEEVKFWLRIMEEHALFIIAGLPCENTDLINQTETFRQEIAALRARADRITSERRFAELVADSQTVIGEFYRFQRRLLHLSLTCQVLGCNFALFLDHVSREAEYFLLILSALGDGTVPLYQVTTAREAAFWLRIMGDHAKFIMHRLDPSERNLINSADEFSCEFDDLFLQGRDFVSMLRGEPDEIPSFRRFLQDVRIATIRLRDFERAVETLIQECRLLGLISALLADHVRREADHFLMILTLIEKGCLTACDGDENMEYMEIDEPVIAETTPGIPFNVAEEMVAPPPIAPVAAVDIYDVDDDDDFGIDREPPEPMPEPTPLPALPAPVLPLPAAPPQKPSKFKWSGKWPRPLGSFSE